MQGLLDYVVVLLQWGLMCEIRRSHYSILWKGGTQVIGVRLVF